MADVPLRPGHTPGFDGGKLGDPHRIEVRNFEGKIAGVAVWHDCVSNGEPIRTHHWAPVDPKWPAHWQLISENPLHIEPSLLCRGCGDHGFIRDGVWVPA